MTILQIIKDLPDNKLFHHYKSDYQFEVLTVKELKSIHKNDSDEYELWNAPDDNYHVTKYGENEITYGAVYHYDSWFHKNSISYGDGDMLNI